MGKFEQILWKDSQHEVKCASHLASLQETLQELSLKVQAYEGQVEDMADSLSARDACIFQLSEEKKKFTSTCSDLWSKFEDYDLNKQEMEKLVAENQSKASELESVKNDLEEEKGKRSTCEVRLKVKLTRFNIQGDFFYVSTFKI